ncbi:DUF2278 family protein [Streptomyces sp. NPDC048269]|uniref:DUF2278 family protein n=1 Tax=Streptomyces sp. NPDC048269 TaxID=3155753 RepID=UPI00341F3CF1
MPDGAIAAARQPLHPHGRALMGMHNIHQNQGDPHGSDRWEENGIRQDGATHTRRPDGRYDVFLNKFSSQKDHTDSDGPPGLSAQESSPATSDREPLRSPPARRPTSLPAGLVAHCATPGPPGRRPVTRTETGCPQREPRAPGIRLLRRGRRSPASHAAVDERGACDGRAGCAHAGGHLPARPGGGRRRRGSGDCRR